MAQFPAVFDLATLNGTNGFEILGEENSDYAGYSISGAGDVNGDGFDDLIVGAPGSGFGFGTDDNGFAYVVFGKVSGFTDPFDLADIDGTNGFRIEGDAASRIGGSVASAGDINGDGFDDIISGGYFDGGDMFVVFGAASGFAASLDVADLDGANGFRIDDSGTAGVSVAGAGNVNGDGLADFIVGAPGASPNGAGSGASYVVFGTAAGFDAELDLTSLDGTDGFRISGEAAGDQSGGEVSAARDVNGDGIDDLIIGAEYADPNGTSSGASHVVFGKTTPFAANLNLASLNGANGFQINGEAAGDQSGDAVAAAGDINGDGFADVIIGAPRNDADGGSSGASYVVFGKGSGFTANFNLGGLNGTNGFRIDGDEAGDLAGFSVAGAGDVNGDGFDDLIVGAPDADDFSGPYYTYGAAGRVYVVFGKATGFGATVDVATLDGDNGFQLDPPGVTGGLGWAVTGAGDLNGDGFDDIAASGFEGYSFDYGPGGSRAYTVFGAKPVDAVNRVGSAIGQTINGGLGADTLSGLGGGDELIGHENNDTLIGGSGNDILNGGSGSDAMSGGTGDDLYFVTSAGDSVTELANQGTDEVRTSRTTTLGANLENLSMIGGAAINGTGNGVGNTMTGNSAANILTGLGGADRLDGKGGADRMVGGASNDIYFIDNAGDRVVEVAGEGTDQVRSAISFTIGNLTHVENLLLTGTGAFNGVGNAGANAILGNAGNNTLNGGAGDDTVNGGFGRDILIGGAGADSFVYFNNALQSGPAANDRDRINHFVSGTDELDLSLMDANLLAAGNQAFAIDTNGSFSTGEIKIEDIGTDLLLSFNIDADAAAEMQIQLRNINSVVAGDFVL